MQMNPTMGTRFTQGFAVSGIVDFEDSFRWCYVEVGQAGLEPATSASSVPRSPN